MRNRITGLEWIPASELVPNEQNWRRHTVAQTSAMQALFKRIGIVDAVVARALPDGRRQLIDGHLRTDIAGDEIMPVLVTDLDEHESLEALATLDPIGQMAQVDHEQFNDLMQQLQPDWDNMTPDDEEFFSVLEDLRDQLGVSLADLAEQPAADPDQQDYQDEPDPYVPMAPNVNLFTLQIPKGLYDALLAGLERLAADRGIKPPDPHAAALAVLQEAVAGNG